MKQQIISGLFAACIISSASAQSDLTQLQEDAIDRLGGELTGASSFQGAVYAMSNESGRNTVVAHGRNEDGSLELIGSFATGGRGGVFDGGEGLDPLISAYALELTSDRRHLLAVNAGSSTITAFRINPDFGLTRTSEAFTFGVGPNSIAESNGQIFVSNIDADGDFAGEPDQEGSVIGFLLTEGGRLIPDFGNFRNLANRPSALRISPDGRNLLVTSINAGSSALDSGSNDELVMYGLRQGQLSADVVAAVTSTAVNNEEVRNLPSAIGFEVVRNDGRQFAVVTEAREFQPNGAPPAFLALQTGSVSTWEIIEGRILEPINLDVIPENRSIFDGQRTACWLAFSANQDFFWVSNALDATISAYSFANGEITVTQEVTAEGSGTKATDPSIAFGETEGWIDIATSENGEFVYQLFGLTGGIGIFQTNADGTLNRIGTKEGTLPSSNTQGIVAF